MCVQYPSELFYHLWQSSRLPSFHSSEVWLPFRCQALGSEIPCTLCKLVSFILYCTHVELPPLDFNKFMWKSWKWCFFESTRALGVCLRPALPHTPSSVFTVPSTQQRLRHPTLPLNPQILSPPWGRGRWAQLAQQTCFTWCWLHLFLFSLSLAKAPEREDTSVPHSKARG